MTITYPLTLPTTPDFKRATFSPRSYVARSVSEFTGDIQVQSHPGQLWGAQFVLPPMLRVAAEEWISFFLQLNGMEGTFLVGDPLGRTARGSLLGAAAVAGAGQTGLTLDTDGWTSGQNGVLLAGDYFQLGSGITTRLYKNLKDVNSDGGGLATLDIWPRLRESPSDSESLVFSSSKGTFRLLENINSWDMNPSAFYSLGFNALEAL